MTLRKGKVQIFSSSGPLMGFSSIVRSVSFKARVPIEFLLLRVHAKINLQIISIQVPAQQDTKIKEYPAYSVFSQRSWAGCMGGENVKLFLREP